MTITYDRTSSHSTLRTVTLCAAAWLTLTSCQTATKNQKTKETVAAAQEAADAKGGAITSKKLSFIDFCRNPKLSGSEKLMKYLHPNPKETCEAAEQRLSKVSNINLKRLEIKDLRAISVFKNAKLMSLSFNPVVDLSPLRGFDKLQVLFLRHIALGDTVAKTEANCPTDDGVFKSIREFCLKR